MDAFEYRFTSKTGDIYIVRILNDGARFLSSEINSALEKSDDEVLKKAVEEQDYKVVAIN